MGNYAKNFSETFDFDGDTITIFSKPLSRVDAMELIPAMADMKGMDAHNMSPSDIDSSNKFVSIASRIIKEGGYISAIKGMFISDVEVAPDTDNMEIVFKDFYFTGFIMLVAMSLIRNSSIGKDTEKKSGEQSKDTDAVLGIEETLKLAEDQ